MTFTKEKETQISTTFTRTSAKSVEAEPTLDVEAERQARHELGITDTSFTQTEARFGGRMRMGRSAGRRRSGSQENGSKGRSRGEKSRNTKAREAIKDYGWKGIGKEGLAWGALVGVGAWASGGVSALYSGVATSIAAFFAGEALTIAMFAGLALIPGLTGVAFWAVRKAIKSIPGRALGNMFPRTAKYIHDSVSWLQLNIDKACLDAAQNGSNIYIRTLGQVLMVYRGANAAVSDLLDGEFSQAFRHISVVGQMLNPFSSAGPAETAQAIINDAEAKADNRTLGQRLSDWWNKTDPEPAGAQHA